MIKASFGISETGAVRSENQDSYLIDSKKGLFAVADGLGGLPNGSTASRMALQTLKRGTSENNELPLSSILAEVNDAVRDHGFRQDVSGCGTTLTVARLRDRGKCLEIAHVGDSAAYLVRAGEARLITVEHTVAARMVADQWGDADEAIPASAHHTLTQCIGQDPYIDPQVLEFELQKGDRLFLMTDGVTKPVPEHQLLEALQLDDSVDRICQALTFRVEIAGSPDNYTVVGLQF